MQTNPPDRNTQFSVLVKLQYTEGLAQGDYSYSSFGHTGLDLNKVRSCSLSNSSNSSNVAEDINASCI